MKLLFEEADRNEVDRVRFLLESNGIPVFVGNEDTARNFNFIALAQKYGVWVLEDEQFACAQALLDNENYEVKHPLDVEEYYRIANQAPLSVYGFMWKKILLPAFILIAGVIALAVFIHSK